METWFITLLIVAAIASVVGPIIWFLVVAFVVKKSYDASANIGATGFGSSELDALIVQLDQMIRAANAASGPSPTGAPNTANLTPQQQLQIQTMLMQAQNQMTQLDNLGRQRYETRLADLSGMAASAGIDWTPGSY